MYSQSNFIQHNGSPLKVKLGRTLKSPGIYLYINICNNNNTNDNDMDENLIPLETFPPCGRDSPHHSIYASQSPGSFPL